MNRLGRDKLGIPDKFPHVVHQYGSAAAIARGWRQGGAKRGFINRSGLSFVLNESPEAFDTATLAALESRCLRLRFDVTEAYQVYGWEPAL